MIRKKILIQNESHQKGWRDPYYSNVNQMVWLILDIGRHGRTDRIDVTVDIHVEVTRVFKIWRDSVGNHAKYTGVIENDHINILARLKIATFENKMFTVHL
jgi:hypothetical protein